MIKEPNGAYSDTYYGLTKGEIELILPYIRKAAKHAEEMANYYQDVLESGEATDRQTTALSQWEQKSEKLNNIVNFMER